jgi:TPR repeat protein
LPDWLAFLALNGTEFRGDQAVCGTRVALLATAMQTPPKLPASSRTPQAMLWLGLLAIAGVAAALLLPPLTPGTSSRKTVEPEAALTTENAAGICMRLSENPAEYLSSEEWQRRRERRIQSCSMAFAAAPYDLTLKVKVALALPHERRAEELAILREAATQGSPEAYYWIYESYKSWDQGDYGKPQLVTRAEADHALHMAAQLGHPFATQMLALLLDRGGIVKRDPVAARYWAERAIPNPASGIRKGDLTALLGRLLATSDKPEERARGLDLLERTSKAGVFGAKRELAKAIRRDDPVRARKLLEEALSSDRGGAAAPLAEMLIAGEGGPADPARALKLLKGSDTPSPEAVLGRLYLEGKLVPRDPQEAARLIGLAGVWSLDARTEVLKILAANPEVRINRPNATLYDAMEAAELDEPGATAALIELKLSDNAQFRDPAGACKLLGTALARGDQSVAPRLEACRGS